MSRTPHNIISRRRKKSRKKERKRKTEITKQERQK